jgi:hypothetical protein
MKGYRKHRGLRRYYRNLNSRVDLEFNWDDFFNPNGELHFHFDWRGYGNNSFARRRPHLDMLFRHFDILVDRTKELDVKFQLYALINNDHSRSYALYFHRPDPLLFDTSNLQTTTTLTNEPLNNYINNLQGYEKRYGKWHEEFCLLFKVNIGQPFQILLP